MAYAALRSLAQILHQTLNRDYQYLILDEKQQIESLVEEVTFLQNYLSSQKITQGTETRIRDAAYIAEDIVESRIIDRFLTESAVRLIRFDLIEFLIVNSSKADPIDWDAWMGFESSNHETFGVGGIEDTRAFEAINGIRQLARTRQFKTINGIQQLARTRQFKTINGIRQLARTRQFKEWFLDIRVLRYYHGAKLVPDAISALERLATSGAKIVIISDYPSTASAIMEDLCRKGFDTSLFVGAITTEDLRRDHFLRADDAWFEVGPSNINITWFDREYAIFPKMYKSATVMADVDAADRRIVVGGDFYCIKAANAAWISSIFITGGLHTFVNTTDVLNHAVIRDAHPTYVLPFFTW